jgi:hypothetical protein
MSGLGKVFAFFLVPVGAICALYFATGLLNVRNQYLTKYTQLAETHKKNEEALRKAEELVNRLDREVNLVMNSWGQEWTAPNSTPQPGAEPMIDLGVGTTQGLAAQPMGGAKPVPAVHLFATDEAGKSTYVGTFDVIDPRADRAGVKLVRPAFPGEAEKWPTGNYRVRDLVPPAHSSNFEQLRTSQIVMNQKLSNEEDLIRIKDLELATSQKLLDRRLAELNGNAGAPAEASEEVKDGLVKTLAKSEGERDGEQAVVDLLRRDLSNKFASLEGLLKKNTDYVQQLEAAAGGSPAAPPVTTLAPSKAVR